MWLMSLFRECRVKQPHLEINMQVPVTTAITQNVYYLSSPVNNNDKLRLYFPKYLRMCLQKRMHYN